MNERIQELSIQANEWASKEESYKSHSQLFTEKFAELIVRECAEVADNADAIRPKWRSIGKWVREHFGVEE